MSVSTKSYPVFDCDAHVVDPLAIWDYLAESDRDLVRDHGYWSDTNYRGLAFLNGSRQARHRPVAERSSWAPRTAVRA